MSIIAIVLHITNYGSIYKSEFILRFRATDQDESPIYVSKINELTKSSQLLHVEPAADSKSSKLTFDITLKKVGNPQILASEIGKLEGISEVVLIASKSDVDY